MTPERWQRLKDRLSRRQPDLTLILDRVHKPHNLAAVVRSADAAGLHELHVVPGTDGSRISRHTAQSAEKWVHIRRHRAIDKAIAVAKQSGARVLAAHLDDHAVDFRSVDYTQPTAVIFGAEKRGVSRKALERVEDLITIPMEGMVQSLNISVACALVLFEAQRQRRKAGFYDHCRLDDEQYEKTLFEWAYPHVARRLRERGEDYPPLNEGGFITRPGDKRSKLP